MPETLWGPWRFVNMMTSYNRRKFHFISKHRIPSNHYGKHCQTVLLLVIGKCHETAPRNISCGNEFFRTCSIMYNMYFSHVLLSIPFKLLDISICLFYRNTCHQRILASSMRCFPTSFSHFEHRLMKALYLWREHVPRVCLAQ